MLCYDADIHYCKGLYNKHTVLLRTLKYLKLFLIKICFNLPSSI